LCVLRNTIGALGLELQVKDKLASQPQTFKVT
jgi:hypothetical protein